MDEYEALLTEHAVAPADDPLARALARKVGEHLAAKLDYVWATEGIAGAYRMIMQGPMSYRPRARLAARR